MTVNNRFRRSRSVDNSCGLTPSRTDKKLGCHRETAPCFVSLNISLSYSRSFEITPSSMACVSLFHWCNYVCISYRFWDIHRQILTWPWNQGYGWFKVTNNGAFYRPLCDFLLVGHCKYSSILYYFPSYLMLNNIFIVKAWLEVTQGHSKWCHFRKLVYSFLFAFCSNCSRILSVK